MRLRKERQWFYLKLTEPLQVIIDRKLIKKITTTFMKLSEAFRNFCIVTTYYIA